MTTLVETPKAAKIWIIENYGTSWEEGRPNDDAQWAVCVPSKDSDEAIFGYGSTLIDAVNATIDQL